MPLRSPGTIVAALALVLPLAPSRSLASPPVAATDSLSAPAATHAEDEGTAHDAWSFLGELGEDFGNQAAYPFRLAKDEPLTFLAGAAGLAALIATDPTTHDWLLPSSMDGSAFQQRMQDYCDLFTWQNVAISVGGFGVYGLLADSPREKDTALMLTGALVTTTAWTGLIKVLTGRQRPLETTGYHSDWTGPGGVFADPGDDRKHRSFPSGHSANTWAIATVLAHQYSAHHVVPVIAYTAAATMSYARIAVGAHWLSDVVAGGAVGYVCARQVIGERDERRGGGQSESWNVSLSLGPGATSLSLTRGF